MPNVRSHVPKASKSVRKFEPADTFTAATTKASAHVARTLYVYAPRGPECEFREQEQDQEHGPRS